MLLFILFTNIVASFFFFIVLFYSCSLYSILKAFMFEFNKKYNFTEFSFSRSYCWFLRLFKSPEIIEDRKATAFILLFSILSSLKSVNSITLWLLLVQKPFTFLISVISIWIDCVQNLRSLFFFFLHLRKMFANAF